MNKPSPGVASHQCPGDSASDLYQVHINGTEVFAGKFLSLHCVHAACSGIVEVVIHSSSPIGQFSISPKRRGIAGKMDGGKLRFSVKCNRPQHLIVSIGDQQKLLLFLDPPEKDAPQIGGSTVVDASAWLKDPTGKEDQTAAFQSAITAVNGTGKTLLVPPGIYLCKTLGIVGCRNFKLYLSPGSLIRTSFQDKDAIVLDIKDSQQIIVFGRGVLDDQSAESKAFLKIKDLEGRGHVIRVFNSSDVLIEGIVARNSRGWSIKCNDCDRLTFRGCKVLAPVECNPMWTDGYNITGGDTVLIENCFAWIADDVFASGHYEGKRESTRFTIRGLVGYSTMANGLRLGYNSTPFMKDFLFEDCDFLHMKHCGICLNARAPKDPGLGKDALPRMGTILVKNCGFELPPYCLGFLLAGIVEEWGPPIWQGVHIEHLEFENIFLEVLPPARFSRIYGIPSDPIGKVVLNQLRIGNRPVKSLGDIQMTLENVINFTLTP